LKAQEGNYVYKNIDPKIFEAVLRLSRQYEPKGKKYKDLR